MSNIRLANMNMVPRRWLNLFRSKPQGVRELRLQMTGQAADAMDHLMAKIGTNDEVSVIRQALAAHDVHTDIVKEGGTITLKDATGTEYDFDPIKMKATRK